MISHNDYLNDIVGCKFHPPLDMDTINRVSISLSLPLELVEFYKQTNGLESELINILPIQDPKNPKYSWDSIGRANDPSTTKFSLDGELLKDFVIFAQLEGGTCGMYSKKDGSIWYEDDEGYHKTKLNLLEFIDLSLKEGE